jgi:hypothetical protein
VVSSCHCVANLSQCLSKLYTVLLRHIVNNQPNNIDNGVRIVDVTGDGLPDFLQCELSSGSVTDCKSWINTGTGWKRDDAYKP